MTKMMPILTGDLGKYLSRKNRGKAHTLIQDFWTKQVPLLNSQYRKDK